jgi:catechol 2,3-dioxygenase
MPVPAANLYPDFNTVRLSHVEFSVTNLAESKKFYVDTLGLQITGEEPGVLYLRAMEERGHHCLILRQAAEARAQVLGFKVWDDADLDKAAAWFTAKGRAIAWVTRPFQGRTLLTSDLFGVPLEFYAKMDRLPPIHQKYSLYHGVKPLRIDHFNTFSPDVDASVAFWNDMGFRVTEYTEDEASGKLWAAWMHRKGGVHDMAFTLSLIHI